MFRISELRRKDVINEAEGKKLGFVNDIEIDSEIGKIEAIIVPGENRFLGFFLRNDEMVLPWNKIKKIGVDVILVGDETLSPILNNIPLIDKGANIEWEEWDL